MQLEGQVQYPYGWRLGLNDVGLTAYRTANPRLGGALPFLGNYTSKRPLGSVGPIYGRYSEQQTADRRARARDAQVLRAQANELAWQTGQPGYRVSEALQRDMGNWLTVNGIEGITGGTADTRFDTRNGLFLARTMDGKLTTDFTKIRRNLRARGDPAYYDPRWGILTNYNKMMRAYGRALRHGTGTAVNQRLLNKSVRGSVRRAIRKTIADPDQVNMIAKGNETVAKLRDRLYDRYTLYKGISGQFNQVPMEAPIQYVGVRRAAPRPAFNFGFI